MFSCLHVNVLYWNCTIVTCIIYGRVLRPEIITTHVMGVLEARENHPEKSMAQLYDPNNMPEALLVAHQRLDAAVEKCYRPKPFTSDEERLEHLFKLYEEMTESEPCLI